MRGGLGFLFSSFKTGFLYVALAGWPRTHTCLYLQASAGIKGMSLGWVGGCTRVSLCSSGLSRNTDLGFRNPSMFASQIRELKAMAIALSLTFLKKKNLFILYFISFNTPCMHIRVPCDGGQKKRMSEPEE